MIVDAHTHIVIKEHLSKQPFNSAPRGVPIKNFIAKPETHYKDTIKADKVFILTIWAPFSRVKIPSDFIAGYIKKDL